MQWVCKTSNPKSSGHTCVAQAAWPVLSQRLGWREVIVVGRCRTARRLGLSVPVVHVLRHNACLDGRLRRSAQTACERVEGPCDDGIGIAIDQLRSRAAYGAQRARRALKRSHSAPGRRWHRCAPSKVESTRALLGTFGGTLTAQACRSRVCAAMARPMGLHETVGLIAYRGIAVSLYRCIAVSPSLCYARSALGYGGQSPKSAQRAPRFWACPSRAASERVPGRCAAVVAIALMPAIHS